MNQQEQSMILNLSEKIGNTSVTHKDDAADKFIQENIATKKDAVYIMTQAILVQQRALEDLQLKIKQLEFQAANNKEKEQGFFSQLFGRKKSVPADQHLHQSDYNYQHRPMMNQNSGISDCGRNESSQPKSSFLSSAMSTALGVAGGMALFNGLEHLFKHRDTGTDINTGTNVTDQSINTDTDFTSADITENTFLPEQHDYLHTQNTISDQEFNTFEEMESATSEINAYSSGELDFGDSFDDDNFI